MYYICTIYKFIETTDIYISIHYILIIHTQTQTQTQTLTHTHTHERGLPREALTGPPDSPWGWLFVFGNRKSKGNSMIKFGIR